MRCLCKTDAVLFKEGVVGAMSFGDGAAVFKARAGEIGLTDDEVKKLESGGLVSMSAFAFCCHFNPASTDEKPLVDLVTKVLGAPPYYEPGDTLEDRAVSMYESDRLQYLDWPSCVSRQHELLTGQRKDSSVSFDGTGALRINTKTVSQPCDVSSDMMVRYALVRRGLALEQANVLAYNLHDQLEKYMAALDPPPGYARIGMTQIEVRTDSSSFCWRRRRGPESC